MKADAISIKLFGERLRSQKYTTHQLRKMLEAMPRNQRFEALLAIFTDPNRDRAIYGHAQRVAGQLLLALRPKSGRAVDDVLRSIASTWNVDVAALPFYLYHIFGRERVTAAAAEVAQGFPSGSREQIAINAIVWWLTEAVVFFPREGTRRLMADVELERAMNKKSRQPSVPKDTP